MTSSQVHDPDLVANVPGVPTAADALVALAPQTASGAATLALPFFSSQPRVLSLVLVPAGLGLVAAGYLRRAPWPRRIALQANTSRN
jgi:hypothetical protein